jgi:class 3 adenylate cyclase
MREAVLAAIRRDPDSLREKIGEEEGAMLKVAQAAGALEPIIEEAVNKRPSRLGRLGLKSARLLAQLTEEDSNSSRRLSHIAKGRTVGIVFVDVAGFTTFTAENGDAAASALLTDLVEIVERKTRACSGEVVKHLGDGFLLAFPSASQAVRGALALNRASIKRRQKDPSFDVRLRIAVHAGEPLVEHDDLLGHDVNLTARLLDHCKAGQVIVSDAAKELSEKRLKSAGFSRRRNVKIRGLAGRVTVWVAEESHRSSSS